MTPRFRRTSDFSSVNIVATEAHRGPLLQEIVNLVGHRIHLAAQAGVHVKPPVQPCLRVYLVSEVKNVGHVVILLGPGVRSYGRLVSMIDVADSVVEFEARP